MSVADVSGDTGGIFDIRRLGDVDRLGTNRPRDATPIRVGPTQGCRGDVDVSKSFQVTNEAKS